MTGIASLRIALDRDPHHIADAAERIAAFCRTHGCSEDAAFRFQVGSAELFNNIYEHGAQPPHVASGSWITARLRVRATRVSLLVLEPPGPAAGVFEPGLPDWTGETGRGLFILTQWFPVCCQRRWHGRTCWWLVLPR